MTHTNSLFPSERWGHWVADIEALTEQCLHLFHKRDIYNAHNDSLSGLRVDGDAAWVHEWLRENYAHAMAVAIRRLVDNTRGTVSLVRLLRSLEKGVAELTYENHFSLWTGVRDIDAREMSRRLFDLFAPGESIVPRNVIQGDLQQLQSVADRVGEFVNRRLAHFETEARAVQAGPLTAPTYDDLHAALEAIAETLGKYMLLLTAKEMATWSARLDTDVSKAMSALASVGSSPTP